MIYNIQRGDICVLPFPFTDLTGQKKRPALALSSADEFCDIIFAFITTKRGESVGTHYLIIFRFSCRDLT